MDIWSQKNHGAAPDIAKAAPVFLHETTKLCRAYYEAAKVDSCTMSITDEDGTVIADKEMCMSK
jgi:5'-3' exoribonuclease 2